MIDDLIKTFLAFIRASWPEMQWLISLDTTASLKDDWLQANWELLVEGSLSSDKNIFLEVYGDGADANSPSSRILFTEAQASHAIFLLPKAGQSITDCLNDEVINLPEQGLPLDRFVTMGNDGWFYERLPFDKVLVNNEGRPQVFDILDVKFSLQVLPSMQPAPERKN